MASKVIERITNTAEKLYQIRQEISHKEEESKSALEALKLERDAIQATLIADLNKNNLSSIKVSNGDSFYKGVRKGVEIVNEAMAFSWAYKNKAVSINKIAVAQILKDATEIPQGFDLIEKEFISVRKNPKNKNNGEEI